jgi:hypothetical protein
MVAIVRIINCEEPPYGLFHVTRTPLAVLREKGLRANSHAAYAVHRLIHRLQKRLAPMLEETANRYRLAGGDTYPLELSLTEQLSIAPSHYSGVFLTLTQEDASIGLNETSEPNRKARAMVDFARQNAPHVFETVARLYKDTAQALSALEEVPDAPWHLLRVRVKPPQEDGYFSMFAEPWLEVNGLLRSYDRGPDLRPEARAIWFNGTIPFDCLEVLPPPPDRPRC